MTHDPMRQAHVARQLSNGRTCPNCPRCWHHCRLGRAEGGLRDHGVPAQPRRRYRASGTPLVPHLSPGKSARIFKTYGADAIQVMTENPYRLARDIRGIGFKTADAIAMKLGIEKAAMVRVYALTEAMDEGHCGLPTDELVLRAGKLLGEVPLELIRTALDLELQEGTVVADRVGETPCVFLAGLHRAEHTVAERLLRLANGRLPWPWIDPARPCPGSRNVSVLPSPKAWSPRSYSH